MNLLNVSDLQTTQSFGNHEFVLAWMTVVSIVLLAGPATLGTALILTLKNSHYENLGESKKEIISNEKERNEISQHAA